MRRPRSARGCTCRRDQATWSAWSRARQATSAGDIRATLRAYQPSREAWRAHTRSGLPLARLSPTAIVALVVATSESSEIGIGAPVRHGLDELRELRPLALVLAAARPRGALPPSGPDRGLPEVVEPGAAAAGRGVERLLGIAGSCRR